MNRLVSKSGVPLYRQLRVVLGEKIAMGDWAPGSLIPSEKELEKTYEVSRTTVRQALRELEYEGLISRHRGRGTFVSEPKLQHSSSPSQSLGDAVDRMGLTAEWQLIEAGLAPVPDSIAMALSTKPGTLLFHTIRLRLVDGNVLGYIESFVGAGIPVAADAASLTSGGSLSYLASDILANGTAERLIDAVAAVEDTARHLKVAVGSPCLRIRRTTFGEDGRAIEYMTAQYRGDRFEYTVPSSRIKAT